MTLQQIADGAPPVSLILIGGDIPLAREIQTQLGQIGLLDPPVDGQFGPVSQWALGQFLKQIGQQRKTSIDAEVARELLDATADDLFPIRPTANLAGRLVRAMQAQGHWVNRHPDCVNIVYVEGVDNDGTPNANTPNEFNDLRVVLRINRSGNPNIVDAWDGTTEPGMFFTTNPDENDGAARIAFGQYKAWVVGLHRRGKPSEHEALVQAAFIDIFRDLDRNFSRIGDRKFTGNFGINQHWGFDFSKSDIKTASAGCLVGRTKTGHRAFMALCKSDPRFQVSNGYRFMTSVLNGADF